MAQVSNKASSAGPTADFEINNSTVASTGRNSTQGDVIVTAGLPSEFEESKSANGTLPYPKPSKLMHQATVESNSSIKAKNHSFENDECSEALGEDSFGPNSNDETYVKPEMRAVWVPAVPEPMPEFDDLSNEYGSEYAESYSQYGEGTEDSMYLADLQTARGIDTYSLPDGPKATSLPTVVLSSPPSRCHSDIESENCANKGEDEVLRDQFHQIDDSFRMKQEQELRTRRGDFIPNQGHLEKLMGFNGNETPFYRKTLDGPVSLSAALTQVEDMTRSLQRPVDMADLYFELGERESEIREIVAAHCGLPSPERVFISSHQTGETWKHGRFNVSIPIYVSYPGNEEPTPLSFKLPLSYMVGEDEFPGNLEERLRIEVATHIWVKKNCSEISIPKLYGFGFPGGVSFIEQQHTTVWQRIKTYAWRIFQQVFYNRSGFCEYIPQKRTALLNHGYMLTERISTSGKLQPLVEHLGKRHNDKQLHHEKFIQNSKTQNLYRSFAKAMLALAKVPQPRIGSWTIDNNGQMSLSNRPLFSHFTSLEDAGVPIGIAQNTTYNNTDSFYSDCIGVFDNQLKYQQNSVCQEREAWKKADHLISMRCLLPNYTNKALREGPFVMQLGNMPINNILIDKDWNVKQFIDVQDICSLPAELLIPPPWVSGCNFNNTDSINDLRFKLCYRQFANTLKHEEAKSPLLPGGKLHSDSLPRALKTGTFWFLRALQDPSGLQGQLFRHINGYKDVAPRPARREAAALYLPYMEAFSKTKVAEYKRYRQEVQRMYNGRNGRVYDYHELSHDDLRRVIPDRTFI